MTATLLTLALALLAGCEDVAATIGAVTDSERVDAALADSLDTFRQQAGI